jgi:Fe-S-cluster containining protein
MVSSTSGRYLYSCPLLEWEGQLATCTIYESRPKVCRDISRGPPRSAHSTTRATIPKLDREILFPRSTNRIWHAVA